MFYWEEHLFNSLTIYFNLLFISILFCTFSQLNDNDTLNVYEIISANEKKKAENNNISTRVLFKYEGCLSCLSLLYMFAY